ncbi:MAG: hypothetical protein V4659_04530 [Pseudomonadota bacterium]
MIVLAAVILAALIPPALPPPPADRVAAARRLLAANPVSAEDRRNAIENALDGTARYALREANVDNRDAARWVVKYDALMDYLRGRIPTDRTGLDTLADECMAERYAGGLAAEDLDAATSFFSSPHGRNVWQAIHDRTILGGCYSKEIGPNLDVNAGLIKIGLKPLPIPRF